MEKKYIFTDIVTNIMEGPILHRIKAVRSFGDVEVGDLGGWIEKEENLSHEGNCWVYDNAMVYGKARVYEDASIRGNAEVCGDVEITDSVEISGNAEIKGTNGVCIIDGYTQISGDAIIKGNEDYIAFKCWWDPSGKWVTWTRSNNFWKSGPFYGTSEELISKGYEESERSGKEYERLVSYVESILKDKQKP